MIGKACPDFPVAGNALYEAADCPSPVPTDLCDLSSASDLSDLASLTAQTFIYPGDPDLLKNSQDNFLQPATVHIESSVFPASFILFYVEN